MSAWKDFDVLAHDGLKLRCRTYPVPQGKPVHAKILYVHGFTEHKSVYEHWFPRFAAQGYEITFFDQRGFGETCRDKSDYGQTNEKLAMSDLDTVFERVYGDDVGPLVMWGHSMGGGITLNYMVIGTYREKFSAFMANSPLIHPHPDLQDWKVKTLPFTSWLLPRLALPVTFLPERCTNDPARYDEYAQDELRHGNLCSTQLGWAMHNRGYRLLDPQFNKNIVDRPLLLSHGTDDHLCDFKAAEKFVDMVKLSDKTLKAYPDMPHELFMLKKQDADAHYKDVLGWLNGHFASGKQTKKQAKKQTK